MAQKTTIVEVARLAGVSVGTVSNVMNGSRVVTAAKTDRVLKAIDDLGYLPNSLAQGLRRQASHVVGLCVPTPSSAYFAALTNAFEKLVSHRGYEIMQVVSWHDPEIELRRVRALLAHRIAGLILVPSAEPQQTFDLIGRSDLPTVIVDRAWDDPRFDYVTLDNYTPMRDATRKLVDLGHTKLALFVNFPQLITTRIRIEAFLKSSAEFDSLVKLNVVATSQEETAVEESLRALMCDFAPSALIISNSRLALIAIRVLRSRGITWPDRISLLVFDEPEWADIVDPPMSIVRHPINDIAQTAWRLLMQRMRTPPDAPRRVELQMSIELRASISSPVTG